MEDENRRLFQGKTPGRELLNEAGYLAQNPDVAAAVKAGYFSSGFKHFVLFGQDEQRLGGLQSWT